MKRHRRIVTVAALALLTAGCEGARRDREAAPTEAITILVPAEERVLGPAWDDTPKFLMFLPLVNYERGSYCGEPTPALAERWEHSPDYRTWTVWLRENVRWHDGVPVTADDIKFTVDLLKHPDVLNYNAFTVDSVAVLDERTAKIFLMRPGRWPLKAWATFYPHPAGDPKPCTKGGTNVHITATFFTGSGNRGCHMGMYSIDRGTSQFRAHGCRRTIGDRL